VEVLDFKGIENGWKSIALELNVDNGTNDGFHGPKRSLRFRCVCPRYDPSLSGSNSKARKKIGKDREYQNNTLRDKNSPGWGAATREGRTAAFCFRAGEGTETRDKEAAELMNRLELFALLTALREIRVTPREVSILVNDGDEDDDGCKEFWFEELYPT